MEKGIDNKVAVIAGGTGLIGRSLVPMLLNEGYRVKLLTRNPKKVQKSGINVDIVEWSGKPDSELTVLLEGADVVINLSGY
ncbi:MAG TPA: NAD(P)H-binding protein, partial [Tenuifilum sp.]|nr:NAD(P)H-binding protein [Tenuifilum sp.]